MKKSNNLQSTGSSSQIPEKKWHLFFEWLKNWWPVIVLLLLLLGAGITKYIWPLATIYSLMIHMIKAISILMLVMYVIYTRFLALETKKMAEASMGLFYSEKGIVTYEINQATCNYNKLCDNAKKITKDIHIKEKKIPEKEFNEIIKNENIPAVSVIIKNLSGRRIEADKIEYTSRHTGSENKYKSIINIGREGTIGPWEDKTFNLICAPEGEVEVLIESILYLDNSGLINKIDLSKSLRIERIRKPENTPNG